MNYFLELMVCPHDTANNPERWYLLAQYLSARLKTHIKFDIALDFQEFHENLAEGDLIYANPQDSLKLIEERGFVPLVKPKGIYDEVVFIANNSLPNPSIKSMANNKIATAGSFIAKMGLHILENHAITPGEIVNQESWLTVVNSVVRGEVNYAFLYDGTYHELSDYSKEMINAFFFSKEKFAYHSFNISPKLLDKRAEIESVMLQMGETPKGRSLLEALEIEGWEHIDMRDVNKFKKIMENY